MHRHFVARGCSGSQWCWGGARIRDHATVTVSAGAGRGLACYGRGGREPTVTDAHCALGHLDPDREVGGGLRLDVDAARRVLDALPASAGGAHGVLAVVRATMARALCRVSTGRGMRSANRWAPAAPAASARIRAVSSA